MDLKALLAAERYEEGFGLRLRPARADIRRAHMRLLVKHRSSPEVVADLNRAESILVHETAPDAANRFSRIGRAMSGDSQEAASLPYLRAALEMRGNAMDCHWLGATLVALDRDEEALPFLERAMSLHATDRDAMWIESTRAKIESRTCWFCGQHAGEKSSVVIVPMHKITGVTPLISHTGWQPHVHGTNTKRKQSRVEVPRCSSCQQEHKRGYADINRAGYIGAAIGAAVGLLGLFAGVLVFFTVMVGLVGGFFAGQAIAQHRRPPRLGKPESEKNSFPAVKRLLAGGWQFGEKPRGHRSVARQFRNSGRD